MGSERSNWVVSWRKGLFSCGDDLRRTEGDGEIRAVYYALTIVCLKIGLPHILQQIFSSILSIFAHLSEIPSFDSCLNLCPMTRLYWLLQHVGILQTKKHISRVITPHLGQYFRIHVICIDFLPRHF